MGGSTEMGASAPDPPMDTGEALRRLALGDMFVVTIPRDDFAKLMDYVATIEQASRERSSVKARFFRSDAMSEKWGEIEEHTVEAEWFQLTYNTLRSAPDGHDVAHFDHGYDAWRMAQEDAVAYSDIVLYAQPSQVCLDEDAVYELSRIAQDLSEQVDGQL